MYIEMKKTGLDVSDLITLVQRRGGGNTGFPYKNFVCLCSNCLYSTKGKCALKECCCMDERIRAHTCTFGEMMRYCFSGIRDNVFQFRLRIAIEREAELKSCFLDAGHRKRFYEGLAYTRKTSKNLIAQIFLLSAYEKRQTFAQIGEQFNISVNRASQVERKALCKLYHPRNLKYYKYGLEGHKVRQAEFEEAERQRAYTEKVMETTIYDLDFSVRTFNNLIRAKCEKVSDLVALSEEDILNLKNMGKKQLAEVALKLKALGLLHTAWEKFLPEEK